jgi:pSer/pThr/pTyr-binding forkhead associated (FHA) protein
MLKNPHYQIIKIGKSPSNDVFHIFENDPTVSNIHCEIFIDDSGNKFLTDLNSTNGTFVNGKKIQNFVKLEKQDIIKLGNTVFNWQAYSNGIKLDSSSQFYHNNELSNVLINKNSDCNYIRDSLVNRNLYLWFILALVPILVIILNNSSNEKNTSIESKILTDNTLTTSAPILFPTSRPINGFSPYDDYYGNGIYHNYTDNTIKVTAPFSKDIVIIFKDLFTNRIIRNEYIRAGNTFSLTGIPFGKYKFFYIYGDDWSAEADFKGGLSKGNFLKNKGVSKSNKFCDVEFEEGYYGTYSLVLQLSTNGNLTTIEGSENDL